MSCRKRKTHVAFKNFSNFLHYNSRTAYETCSSRKRKTHVTFKIFRSSLQYNSRTTHNTCSYRKQKTHVTFKNSAILFITTPELHEIHVHAGNGKLTLLSRILAIHYNSRTIYNTCSCRKQKKQTNNQTNKTKQKKNNNNKKLTLLSRISMILFITTPEFHIIQSCPCSKRNTFKNFSNSLIITTPEEPMIHVHAGNGKLTLLSTISAILFVTTPELHIIHVHEGNRKLTLL